jgi:maltose O-acetyltransferase
MLGQAAYVTIGERCAIGRVNFQLHDRVMIGNCVVINDGVHIMTGTHDINTPGWDFQSAPVRIDDYAWVATGATLLPGVTVGEGAVVGAFAVVSKNVEPYTVVAGNPAKVVSQRTRQPFTYWPASGFAALQAWIG